MKSFKGIIGVVSVLCIAVGTIHCGGSSATGGDSGTTTVADVSDLSQLPSITDMVGEDADASLSSYAVTGTPPILREILPEDVDSLFYGGLLAELGALGQDEQPTQDQFDRFWKGESSCRMGSGVGFAFQDIESAGTSLCYMKFMPTIPSAFTVEAGILPEGGAANLFLQEADTKLVQINVAGGGGDGEGEDNADETIFIKVWGSSETPGTDGYAADLWFCDEGSATARGYENIRVNSGTGVISHHSVENSNSNGAFTSDFTGHIITGSDGLPTFDRTQEQSVVVSHSSSGGEQDFGSFKALVTVLGTTLSVKNINERGDGDSNQIYLISEYTGTDISNMRFLSAGVSGKFSHEGSDNLFSAAVEYQDPSYVYNGELPILTTVADFDFDADTFFLAGFDQAEEDLVTTDYPCTGLTPIVVVSLNMEDPTFQTEVESRCENHFQDMNFCDTEEVWAIRDRIQGSQHFGDGGGDDQQQGGGDQQQGGGLSLASCNGNPTENTAIDSTSVGALCACNGINDATQCGQMQSACEGASLPTIGDCVSYLNSQQQQQ